MCACLTRYTASVSLPLIIGSQISTAVGSYDNNYVDIIVL